VLARPKTTARPSVLPPSASTADRADPPVSERSRGEATAGGVARRRWLLRRRKRCLRARLILADLGEPLLAAINATKRGGDGHGGAQSLHGRLRRGHGVSALMAGSTSFSKVHRNQRKGEKERKRA